LIQGVPFENVIFWNAKCTFHKKPCIVQLALCENLTIFLLLRFYVKSILSFWHIDHFSSFEYWICKHFWHFQVWNAQTTKFKAFWISLNWFHENPSSRKFATFPHCDRYFRNKFLIETPCIILVCFFTKKLGP